MSLLPGTSRATVVSVMAVLCLVWGSTWLVIREGLEDLPPFFALSLRFTVAALAFALLAPLLHGLEGGSAPPLRLSLVLGSTVFLASYAIVYWGETHIPSGLASVLWALFPLFTALWGHFLLPGERLSARQWAGLGCALAGVALLFATDLRSLGPGTPIVGLVFLLSPLVSALGNVSIKRHGSAVSSVLLNRAGLAWGAAGAWILTLAVEHRLPERLTARAVFSVLYLALAGTVLTFGLYYWLLRRAPAQTLSLISYVVPAIALLLGWGLGEEEVGLHTVAGLVLILAGVAAAASRRRPARAEAAEPAAPAPSPAGGCVE